jgi:hypothetical protein
MQGFDQGGRQSCEREALMRHRCHSRFTASSMWRLMRARSCICCSSGKCSSRRMTARSAPASVVTATLALSKSFQTCTATKPTSKGGTQQCLVSHRSFYC